MYSLLSTSHMREPSPRAIKTGSPPTDLNARTGESTPPGITCSARCCSLRDFSKLRAIRKPASKNENWLVYQRPKHPLVTLLTHRLRALFSLPQYSRLPLYRCSTLDVTP